MAKWKSRGGETEGIRQGSCDVWKKANGLNGRFSVQNTSDSQVLKLMLHLESRNTTIWTMFGMFGVLFIFCPLNQVPVEDAFPGL